MGEKFKTAFWTIPLALGGVLLVISLSYPFLPWQIACWNKMRQGERIISRIEAFKGRNARLPDPRTESPFAADVPEYRLTGPEDYEIEYYIGADGPAIIYSSTTKQWRCDSCD
jgi:hypothetical protein